MQSAVGEDAGISHPRVPAKQTTHFQIPLTPLRFLALPRAIEQLVAKGTGKSQMCFAMLVSG